MTSLTPLILTLLLTPALIIAAPPTSKYTPGETTDPNCAPGTTNCDILFTESDTTDDAFLNNQAGQRVELTTKSDGSSRDLGTEFSVTDEGNIGLGVIPASNRRIDVLSQEERSVMHIETLDRSDSDQAYSAFEASTPISRIWMSAHGEHRTASRWGLPSLAGWTELIGISNGSDQALFKGMAVGTKSNAPLIFGTNDAERMRITDEGLVGIGTPDPQNNRLSVSYSSPYTSGRSILATLSTSTAADVTSYDKAIHAYLGNFAIPTGVRDSGYKIGVDGSAYVATDNFQGTVSTTRGVWARSGIHDAGVGGHIDNVIGLYAEILANDADGSIDNAYGVYIGNGAGTTPIGNNYGIYQATPTARNYLSGRLGIGTTTPVSPLAISGLPSGTDDSVADGALAGALCITDTGNLYIDRDGTCAN